MINFSKIAEPDHLFQWFHEHTSGEMSAEEVAVLYNQCIITIDSEMVGGMTSSSYVQFTEGDITGDDGVWYKTNVIQRSADKVKLFCIVFVMDAQDMVQDVVYMGPDDPRVVAAPHQVH